MANKSIPRTLASVGLLFCLFAACSKQPSGDEGGASLAPGSTLTPPPGIVEPPIYSGTFTPPDRSVLKTLDLPKTEDGLGYVLYPGAYGTLAVYPDQRQPISAASECVALILTCFEPGVRNFTGCFEHATVCTTETPWVGDDPTCCPAACAGRYGELRNGGMSDIEALTTALMKSPSCMPGFDSYMER